MKEILEKIVKVSDREIQALKFLVANAPLTSDNMKKMLIYLIDQSENLTKPIAVRISDPNWHIGITEETSIIRKQHKIMPFTPNYLSAILKAMGSAFHYENTERCDVNHYRETIDDLGKEYRVLDWIEKGVQEHFFSPGELGKSYMGTSYIERIVDTPSSMIDAVSLDVDDSFWVSPEYIEEIKRVNTPKK